MIKPEQIPPEVVEKLARTMCDEAGGDASDDDSVMYYRPIAIEAIAAALSAWPGAETGLFAKGGRNVLATILPLAEARDGE